MMASLNAGYALPMSSPRLRSEPLRPTIFPFASTSATIDGFVPIAVCAALAI